LQASVAATAKRKNLRQNHCVLGPVGLQQSVLVLGGGPPGGGATLYLYIYNNCKLLSYYVIILLWQNKNLHLLQSV